MCGVEVFAVRMLGEYFGASGRACRRGSVLVAMLVVLLVLTLVVSAVVLSASRDSQMWSARVQGVRAQRAAEAAANMAIKEMIDNIDRDGDGGIGTISNDGNTANDPKINNGTRMWATRVDAGSATTITARAQNGEAARAVAVGLVTGSIAGPDPRLFYTDSTDITWPMLTRTWDGAAWSAGAQVAIGTSDAYQQLDVAGNAAGEAVLLGINASGSLNRFVLSAGAWSAATAIGSTGSPNAPVARVRYEAGSGRALIVYRSTAGVGALYYQQLSGGTVVDSGSTALGFTEPIDGVLLEDRAGSSEMWAVARSGASVVSKVWDGSAWSATVDTHSLLGVAVGQTFAAAYEGASGDRLVAVGESASIVLKGGAASPLGVVGTVVLTSRPTFVRLVRSPKVGSDEVMLVYGEGSGEVTAVPWNGSALDTANSVTLTAAGVGPDGIEPLADVAYQSDGLKAVVAYVRRNQSQVRFRVWDGSAWSAEQLGPNLSAAVARVRLSPGKSMTEVIAACQLVPGTLVLSNHVVYGGSALTLSGGTLVHGRSGAGVYTLPSAGAIVFGGTAVTIADNGSQTLTPGNYGNVTMGNDSTLTLDGSGTYRFRTFNAAGKTNVRVRARTTGAANTILVTVGIGSLSAGSGFVWETTGGSSAELRVMAGNLDITGAATLQGLTAYVYGNISVTGAVLGYGNFYASGNAGFTGGGDLYGYTALGGNNGPLVAFAFTNGSAGSASTIMATPRGMPIWDSFTAQVVGGLGKKITGWAVVDPAVP